MKQTFWCTSKKNYFKVLCAPTTVCSQYYIFTLWKREHHQNLYLYFIYRKQPFSHIKLIKYFTYKKYVAQEAYRNRFMEKFTFKHLNFYYFLLRFF